MSRIDIMVDIETLGHKLDSTIIQIAAVAFDIKTGEHIARFNKLADITKNEDYDMNITAETLVWWLNTNPDLLKNMLNNGSGSSRRLLEDFYMWMEDLKSTELHFWGNGILFDNAIIRYQLELNGYTYPIHRSNDRDLRTLVDIYCTKRGIDARTLRHEVYDLKLEAHNAFNDVTNQIKLAVKCYNELIL